MGSFQLPLSVLSALGGVRLGLPPRVSPRRENFVAAAPKMTLKATLDSNYKPIILLLVRICIIYVCMYVLKDKKNLNPWSL